MKPITELTDAECMELIRTSTAGGTYALQQANRRIAELERKNAELEEKFENLDEEYEGAKVHLRQLEAENKAIAQRVADTEGLCVVLHAEAEDANARARMAESEVNKLRNQTEELHRENAAIEKAYKEVTQYTHYLERENGDLLDAVDSLERQLADTQAAVRQQLTASS